MACVTTLQKKTAGHGTAQESTSVRLRKWEEEREENLQETYVKICGEQHYHGVCDGGDDKMKCGSDMVSVCQVDQK